MSVVHKCDVCKKPIDRERTVVDMVNYSNRFEFCSKCASPILAILKKYKLLTQ